VDYITNLLKTRITTSPKKKKKTRITTNQPNRYLWWNKISCHSYLPTCPAL